MDESIWETTFNDSFWLTLAGIVSGIVLALIKTSNCTKVRLCCFSCERPSADPEPDTFSDAVAEPDTFSDAV